MWKSDLIVKIQPPTVKEVHKLQNRTLISFIQPAQNSEIMALFQGQNSTVFAMDQIPRLLSR
jgi:NAD/NADP transhydrogenase alpha subunit